MAILDYPKFNRISPEFLSPSTSGVVVIGFFECARGSSSRPPPCVAAHVCRSIGYAALTRRWSLWLRIEIDGYEEGNPRES
ncbi:hypothetical protein Dimus_021465 [Dionaea muscipula]